MLQRRRRKSSSSSEAEARWKRKRRRPAAALAALAILCGAAAAFASTTAATSAAATAAGAPQAGIPSTLMSVLGDVGRQLLDPGGRRDGLTLLLATATVIPMAKAAGLSPILGFLATGVALGPNGLGIVTELSTTEALAELGVVFFLFEMGLELSMERLGAMKKEIFGLGLAQFVATTAICGKLVHVIGGGAVSATAAGLVGGALALSSSAFVLQLLRDQDELGTTHGRASLGVLLLQDLAVVPLLVLTPLLAGGGGSGLVVPLVIAGLKAVAAVIGVEWLGKKVLNKAFDRAARSGSQEAFLSVVLLAAVGVSGVTESIGLSDTLGAFLAGVSLSETKYASKVEADVAPFRGMLLGLFFVTVGFSIDVNLIAAKPLLITGLAAGLLGIKAAIIWLLGLAFRVPMSSSLRSGCLLAQGGEFGFVAFGLANRLGLLSDAATRLLLTVVALSMAATPVVAGIGASAARFLEDGKKKRKTAEAAKAASPASASDAAKSVGNGATTAAEEEEDDDIFGSGGKKDELPDVVVCGYSQLGKVVCETLDTKLRRYVVIEKNPTKAEAARRDGRPVYQGDLTNPATQRKFRVKDAKLVVVAINGDPTATNQVVIALKRNSPEVKIVARATDQKHVRRLRRMGDNVVAVVPTLRDDSRLMTLPFGGAVLRGLGARADDVDMLIEEKRRAILGPIYAPKKVSGAVPDSVDAESALESEGDKVSATDVDDDDDDDSPKPLMAQCLSDDVTSEKDGNLKIVVGNANETLVTSS